MWQQLVKPDQLVFAKDDQGFRVAFVHLNDEFTAAATRRHERTVGCDGDDSLDTLLAGGHHRGDGTVFRAEPNAAICVYTRPDKNIAAAREQR